MDSNLGIAKEVIVEALAASMEPGTNPEELKIRRSSSQVIVALPKSWSPEHWFPQDSEAKPFGDTPIGREKFRSLRTIGKDVDATVNGAFMARFLRILNDESGKFRAEVKEAVGHDKQIIFTGHSSGGPIAIYTTVWFLEKYIRSNEKQTPRPLCLTFGSPLTTDRTFCHAIRREGWSDCFVHFVTKLDIVPRILLAPPSSTRELLEEIFSFSDPHHKANQAKLATLFVNVMKNTSCVANYAACELTGSKHTLFDTMSRFIKLSPYRPCGKYVFCTENCGFVVVKNPDAVLQLLFYSLQIKSETELQKRAEESFKAHWRYEGALNRSLAPHSVVCLQNLRELPLSSDDAALNDLNLFAPARLCLRAAGELEKKKQDNQKRIEGKVGEIESALNALEKYRTTSKEGYYDAFKLQKEEDDFKANVKRLELAAIWDEIIELLRHDRLPDGFEADEKWVVLGTRFRRLVEPIDIANYYRHSRDDVAGPYLEKGRRPSRYRFTQKWREHAEHLQADSSGESSFWAKVEELKNKPWEKIRNEVLDLGAHLKNWCEKEEVESDLFSKKSTLVEWWQALCKDHAELHGILPIPPVE
ncbi:protein EDS1L-like [Syzygium oleosum]|uniref:protein EDS1L-like n=1 Tax=Syzygium oleosum TaxID=219896 RepID=UPI0024BB15E9|nr:protein EDS1L-like [Syzygium oleosum]